MDHTYDLLNPTFVPPRPWYGASTDETLLGKPHHYWHRMERLARIPNHSDCHYHRVRFWSKPMVVKRRHDDDVSDANNIVTG